MPHPEQLRFVDVITSQIETPSQVLEIGSLDHGGGIRQFFQGSKKYVGVDLCDGPGVDLVASGHEVSFDNEYFDLTISCECFEHNPFWKETFLNMYRMTRPGGLVVMTCASKGRLEHGTTRTSPQQSIGSQTVGWDYYLNLSETDFRKHLDMDDLFSHYRFLYVPTSHDLYFFGVKPGPNAMLTRENISIIDRECGRIQDLKWNNGRPIFNLGRKIARVPLNVASRVLSEQQFQNVAVPYKKFFDSFGINKYY